MLIAKTGSSELHYTKTSTGIILIAKEVIGNTIHKAINLLLEYDQVMELTKELQNAVTIRLALEDIRKESTQREINKVAKSKKA